MYREIHVRRLSAGTVFKLVSIGLAFTVIPLSLLMGLLAMFGASTVTWNRQAVTGLYGLLASSFSGLLMVLFLTLFMGSCIALGLWLFSKFRPIVLLIQEDGEAGVG